jgi:CBS domain-containing protein
MITVRDILKGKPNVVWTIEPRETVYNALLLLAEKDIGALIVVQGERVVGVFSERDYARKGILKGKSSRDTSVGDLMTTKVYYAQLDNTVEECMALLTEKRIRHIPVLEEGLLVGILSIGDVVKTIMDMQEHTIKQLESYITGFRS